MPHPSLERARYLWSLQCEIETAKLWAILLQPHPASSAHHVEKLSQAPFVCWFEPQGAELYLTAAGIDLFSYEQVSTQGMLIFISLALILAWSYLRALSF